MAQCFKEKALLEQAEKLKLGMKFKEPSKVKAALAKSLNASPKIVAEIKAAYKSKK